MKVFNPNYTIIDGIRPKVIETAKGFLLNTQYYDKSVLSPIPFESLSLGSSAYVINTYKNLYLKVYSWNRSDNDFGIIQDSINPNRYYFKIVNGYVHGTRQEFLVCVEEKNGEIIYISHTNIGDLQIIELLDQDDKYLYISVFGNRSSRIYTYDKKTFVFTQIYIANTTYNYICCKKIYSNESHIYFSIQYNMEFYFVMYDKTTKATQETSPIYRGNDSNPVNYYYTARYDNIIDLSDGKYGFYAYNPGNTNQPLDLYIIDTNQPIINNSSSGISIQHVNITWGKGLNEIPFLTTIQSQKTYYRTSILEINGLKYLNVYVYNENYENIAYISIQGIYTFLINSNTNLVLVGFNKIDSAKQFGGILESENKRHLLIAKNNSFQILKFDTNTQQYENTGIEITSCCSVGFDELQRIWYEKNDTSVDVINLEDAQSVQINFEKTHYEYTGTIINTFIEFSALNYLNEEMIGKFKLTLSGSAVFTENNSNELIFDYEGLGIKQIGININGANPVTIYPQYIS